MSKLNTFKSWMAAATPAEQEELAEHLETTRGVLYQYSGEFRQMSPGRARKLEAYTLAMHRISKGRLPKVYRTDVNTDCRDCDFAQRCLGQETVTVSEFPLLPAVEIAPQP